MWLEEGRRGAKENEESKKEEQESERKRVEERSEMGAKKRSKGKEE